MKIGYFAPECALSTDENSYTPTVAAHVAQNHQVEFMTTQASGKRTRTTAGPISVVPLKSPLSESLARYVRTARYDIVHVVGRAGLRDWISAQVTPTPDNTKVVFSTRDTSIISGCFLGDEAASPKAQLAVNKTLATAPFSVIVAHNNGLASVLRDKQTSDSRIELIRPGINLDVFHPAAQQETAQSPDPPDAAKILCAPQFAARERLSHLARAVGHLPPDYHLTLLEPDKAPAAYNPRNCIAQLDRVELLPAQGSLPQTADVYRQATICVVVAPPFKNARVSALRAMACGTPVVSIGPGGPGGVVNEKTGLVAPYVDRPDDIANVARRLIEDSTLRETLARAALSFVQTEHDLGSTIRQYEALYAELAPAQ